MVCKPILVFSLSLSQAEQKEYKEKVKLLYTFHRFVEESCLKILPELEIDYTPSLSLSYDQLPPDLKIWEERESFLLDNSTRKKVKTARGCLVAKSLEKEDSRSSIIWRLSINSAPLMQKAVDHFSQLCPPCSVKKVLRLIKDIKQVSLTGNEKDFLKSYNVRQAMLWTIHHNPGIASEAELLTDTLRSLIQFYKEENLPSFLEPKRNLLFKMKRTGLCDTGATRVEEVLKNIETWIDAVKEKQARNVAGIDEVRKELAPMAKILLFPVVSERIAEKTTRGLNKDLTTRDGRVRSYFEDDKMVDIRDKGRDEVMRITERQALKSIIRDWVISILTYVTEKDAKNDEVIIEEEEEEIPSVKSSAIEDLVNSILEVLPTNKRNDRKVNEFVGVLGAVAEVVPEVHDAIPEVTDIVKSISPLVGNLFKFLKK